VKLYSECRWDVINKTTLEDVLKNKNYESHEDKGDKIEVFYDGSPDFAVFYKDIEVLREIIISNHERGIINCQEVIKKAREIFP
jgi:hypothetical protein